MTRRKTYFVQAIIFLCLSFASIFGCSTRSQALHRLKEMKAADYFSTQPQIDLANAITEGDTNKMQMLIADGANVNYLGNDSMMPLFWAIAKQNFRAFKFLLDHGANPDAIANTHHLSQYSALTLAAIFNDSKYLQELLAHGANPNAPVGNAHKTAIFLQFLMIEVTIFPFCSNTAQK
jgi:ankyrin repeat protein